MAELLYNRVIDVKVTKKKVTITQSGMHKLEDGDDVNANTINELEYAIHQDFRKALDELAGHASVIFGLHKGDYKKVPAKVLEKIRINGMSISGSGEGEGGIIKFMLKDIFGKWHAVNTSKIVFENIEAYEHAGEFYADIQNIKKEAQEYLDGKCIEQSQYSIEFAKENVGEESE